MTDPVTIDEFRSFFMQSDGGFRGALLRVWQAQCGRHRRPSVRPYASLDYIAHGKSASSLIPIERLLLVVVHDQAIHGRIQALVTGLGARRIPHGVEWGGPARCHFRKDLCRRPSFGAKGARLDLDRPATLQLALKLDRLLERHRHYPFFPRPLGPRLPQLWFAFPQNQIGSLRFGGPELHRHSRESGVSSSSLLANARREHQGFALFPMEWVSDEWQRAVAVFADLTTFPRRQVFDLGRREALQGFAGAATFDLTCAGTERATRQAA